MRILIPTVDYPPIEGGIATLTRHVARELAAMGHDVTVVAPWFPAMDAWDAGGPARVLRFHGYHIGWLRYVPLSARCRPLLRNCDLIVAPNVAYGGVLGLRSNIPYITFAYAYEFLKFQHIPPLAGLLRKVYQSADVTVAISNFTHDRLIAFGVPQDRIETVLPGADWPVKIVENAREICAVSGVRPDRFILATGRLVPRKGQETLINAMPRVLAEFPNVQLVVVGRGPCEGTLRDRVRSLGITERVTFLGRVDDDRLAALYQECALFALPTEDAGRGQVEGFGLVFTEAHARGKAVVAGRSGGVVDAVFDGETGILVEPGDADALGDALLRLLHDPAESKRMGNAGRERVIAELNWNAFTRRTLAAWERRQ